MKIIAIKGRHDCGKSETVGIHLKEMITGRIVPKENWWKEKDKRESVSYGGNVIDICAPGDSEEIVRANITFFEKHPCDIAFTATRSRGHGCWALEDYAKEKGAELIWINKEYNLNLDEEGQIKTNKQLAEKLFEMI